MTIIRLDDGGQGIKSHLRVDDHVSHVRGGQNRIYIFGDEFDGVEVEGNNAPARAVLLMESGKEIETGSAGWGI